MQTTLSQKKIFNLQVPSIDIILYLDYILKHVTIDISPQSFIVIFSR